MAEFYAFYADDGAIKSTEEEIPHRVKQLHAFCDREDLEKFVSQLIDRRQRRKNARIEHIFSRGDFVSHLVAPVVPSRLESKRWRIDASTGFLVCDADCASWSTSLCTCGLLQHLRYYFFSMEEPSEIAVEEYSRRLSAHDAVLSQLRHGNDKEAM